MRSILVLGFSVLLVTSLLVSGASGQNLVPGTEVPGPVGPDLSTRPSLKEIPYRVTGPGAGKVRGRKNGDISTSIYDYWTKKHVWDGKDTVEETWDYLKTVVGLICDSSMDEPCPMEYSESRTTSGSWTTSIDFDVDIVKAETGFNIGYSVTKTAKAAGSVTPGYTGYIDLYDVWNDANWYGHTDYYFVSCGDWGCDEPRYDYTEWGGGTARGTHIFGAKVYQRPTDG